MITLQPIDEYNFKAAEALKIRPEQEGFVVPAADILARAYAYRRYRSACFGIYAETRMVGLILRMDVEEEGRYYLFEFLMDADAQGKGYGQQALALFLSDCRREGKYSEVEVCVKRQNARGIHVYEKAGFRDTGWSDPNAPDLMCMVCKLPPGSRAALQIRLTGEEDLEHVRRLWASPEVMRYVGFPEGLQETEENLRSRWLPWVQQPPKRQHYSVYAEGIGYCGETFYDVDDTGLAAMDIKLLPEARGQGIAYASLSHALTQAFSAGGAKRAYVDPNPENARALALYAALGFLPAERPAHLEDPGCPCVYLEMTLENWEARKISM